MSLAAEKLAARTAGNRPLAIGVALLLVTAGLLAVLGRFVAIEPLLRGWLVAFAIFSSIPIGSMTWLLIHRLTGGEWGFAAAPVLRPAAAMTPLLVIAFVPVLAGLHQIYPWAADPAAIPADVAHRYLNEPSFMVRSLIALVGWSFLAVIFAFGSGSSSAGGIGTGVFRTDYQSDRGRLVPVAGTALCGDHLRRDDRDSAAARVTRSRHPDRLARNRRQGGGRSWWALDRGTTWSRLFRIHDFRGRLVWRSARKGRVVFEAGRLGLDFRFDHGAGSRRSVALRDAADAADPP